MTQSSTGRIKRIDFLSFVLLQIQVFLTEHQKTYYDQGILLTAAIAITATLTSSASFQRFRRVPSPQRHRQHTELQKPYIPEEQPDTATLTGAEMLDMITPLRPASDFAYAAVLALGC